ncbi:MAG: undecaprenyl-diphosphate phosphatase [Tissierellia bacterium]|nr:undecaprenyl-diphosphate phosphatase [Tissierellia bacterium]
MDIIRVILLGIIEGVTEFLPVSSTGHLILAHEFLSLKPASFQNAFDVIIQLGAILSVVVLYFNKLNPFSKKDQRGRPAAKDKTTKTLRLWVKVLVGVLPAAVLGFLFDDWIDAHLFNPRVVAAMLILWGILIILVEKGKGKNKATPPVQRVEDIPYGMALAIGFFQCLAMVPGTSRSAATIIGAMVLGSSRVAAAEFSFFLAIPTMLGATLLKILKNGLAFTAYQWFLVLLGLVVSFLVAAFVIKSFLGYIKRHDFQAFGYYRIILGLLVFIYFYLVGA